jgi:hypothetical protein
MLFLIWLNFIDLIEIDVGEVSSRFDFFQRIFTYLSVSKKLTSVSYRTRRALSSGIIRFSIDLSMAQKISKYPVFLIKFRHYIRVKATYIHLLHCVNSKDTCVRYNSTSSIQWYTLFIDSLKYNFWTAICARKHLKIVLRSIEDLSMPLDMARRVVSDTSIFRIDTVKKVNISSFYSNIMPEFY